MTLYRGYVGAGSKCSAGPTPGALALESWYLGAYKAYSPRNDGVFNCRLIRGSTSSLSLHAVGRAADLGCTAGAAWAGKLADMLVHNSAELGIQCVIFNRRIWSGAHPDSGWRPYSGVDPHTTHLHVELSVASAKSLTVARIAAVLAKETTVPIAALPKETGMELKDLTVKLASQAQVDWMNANGSQFKLNDQVEWQRLAVWGGPAMERLLYLLVAQGKALDAQSAAIAALTAKVNSLTLPNAGPPVDVKAIAAALVPALTGPVAKAVNDEAARRLAS